MRASTPRHWDDYWKKQDDLDDAYSNEDRLIDALLAQLNPKGRKVLEVGGGSGRDSIRLAQMGAHVTVIDYVRSSLDVVARNAKRLNAQIELVHGDALSMPFEEGTFDVVFHQGLMEHFRDPGPLLRENRRVLKEGGVVLIDVPQRWHAYTAMKHVLIAMNRWFAGWETEYSIGELTRTVEKEGFHVIGKYGDWMVPGLFYRAARRALAGAGIAKLPKYPSGIPPFAQASSAFRNAFRKTPAAFYTFAMIGVVGKKV
jgi:ubiquinone/menaquinone biosynthesis C-methylase UbiE